jgi:hypothetical protein
MEELIKLNSEKLYSSLYLVEQINLFRAEEVITENSIFCFFVRMQYLTKTSKEAIEVFKAYSKLSSEYGLYNHIYFMTLYNDASGLRREETSLGAGKRSENKIFTEEKVLLAIPTIIDMKWNYSINGKFIDLLGKCKDTGKTIVVEFKKDRKDASTQLYAYQRHLGQDDVILISFTEYPVKRKQEGIIYLSINGD